MAQVFDAYQSWLGIPPADQPPHHYRLLGLPPLENSPEAIENAANRAAQQVRAFQTGPYKLVAQRLNQEISAARACLLDPDRKVAYDQQLRMMLANGRQPGGLPGPGQSGIGRAAVAVPLTPVPMSGVAPGQPLQPIVVEVPLTPMAAQPAPGMVPFHVQVAAPMPSPAVAAAGANAPQPGNGKPAVQAGVAEPAGKPKERIPQPVKIIGGGLGGIALGWLVVYFITGSDVAGILPDRNPEPVVAKAPVKPPKTTRPIKKPNGSTPKPVPEIDPPVTPAEKPGEPTTPVPPENSGSTGTEVPPVEVGSSGQPAVNPQVPAVNSSIPSNPPRVVIQQTAGPSGFPRPTPRPNPTPTEPKPPIESPAAKTRQPTPPAEAQQKMLAELKSIYQTEFERGDKADGRAEFVSFLLQTARKLKSDPVAQFVLCREAYDRALRQENFVAAAEVVDELERGFEVDGYRFRMHILAEAAKAAKSTDERLPLVYCAIELADYALATERAEDVGKLANTAEGMSRNLPSREFKTQVTTKCIELRKAVEDWGPVSSARKQLAANPQDAAASTVDGKYRCFVSGDWPAGLKLLAQSDHPALAAAANLDLAGAAETSQQVALGDAWFDLAVADPTLATVHARARHWYLQARPSVDGFDKIKVEKRIEQIDAMKLPAKALGTADTTAPTLASARFMITRLKTFEPTDLLAATAMAPQAVRTQGWYTSSSYMRVDDSASRARLQSPVNPTGEYQMALKIRREQSYGSSSSPPKLGVFVVGLPSLRSQFLVVLDYPFPGKGYASFLTLQGYKKPEENPTFKLTNGPNPRITTTEDHVLVCAVKLGEVIVKLDGEDLMTYKGDLGKLVMLPEWSVPDARSLFLGSHQGSFYLTGWSVAPLVAEDGSELPLMTEPLTTRDRFDRFPPGIPRPPFDPNGIRN